MVRVKQRFSHPVYAVTKLIKIPPSYVVSRHMHVYNIMYRSVDPQKNRRNYLITRSILKFQIPRRPSLQRRSFDIFKRCRL